MNIDEIITVATNAYVKREGQEIRKEMASVEPIFVQLAKENEDKILKLLERKK